MYVVELKEAAYEQPSLISAPAGGKVRQFQAMILPFGSNLAEKLL